MMDDSIDEPQHIIREHHPRPRKPVEEKAPEDMTRSERVDRPKVKEYEAGLNKTQLKQVNAVKDAIYHPDEAPRSIPKSLRTTKLAPVMTPTALYKDKGARLETVRAICQRAKEVNPPTTYDGILDELDAFLEFCGRRFIPPTYGLYAAWCGTSSNAMDERAAHAKDPSYTQGINLVKEIIRGFLETAAMEGDISPRLYMHQNMAYFNARENLTITHEVSSNVAELTADEVNEIIDILPEEE